MPQSSVDKTRDRAVPLWAGPREDIYKITEVLGTNSRRKSPSHALPAGGGWGLRSSVSLLSGDISPKGLTRAGGLPEKDLK